MTTGHGLCGHDCRYGHSGRKCCSRSAPGHAKGGHGAGGPEQAAHGKDKAGRGSPDIKDHGHDRGGSYAPSSLITLNVITTDERRIIYDYINRHDPLFRPAPLPPGIARNYARGKPLPPGIAKKQLPGPLLGRLPQRDGYEWRQVGSDIVLLAAATGIIVDILDNVID
ncbi:anti-virulence regulator CigR family protein [Tistrella bauzanensis]